MYLKKLSENRIVTIEYFTNNALQSFKGRVLRLNILDQVLWLKDDNQKSIAIHLSCIRNIQ
jgi:YolD-like protein